MAKYSDIKGFTVQTLSTDTVASQLAGGSWASDANMNTARIASTGTGSSSEGYIIAGGYYLPPSVDRSATESYNGTAWSEVQDCPQDLTYGNGLGSYTSSLLCSYSQPGPAPGGFGPTTATHQWNGSSWSTKNSMNTFRQNAGTGGTTTAGIVFGGSGPPANANTETWDGTNWTEVGDLNTAKTDIGGGVGTSTAALSASGNPATTEQWDGSSWTEVSDLNTSRQNSGKVGLYTSALCVSGQNPSTYLANVEAWDGTSWTEVSDVSAARGYIGGATISGGNESGIVAGGAGPGSPGLLSSTEIWTAPSVFSQITEGQLFFNSTANTFKETITDFPSATWSSGGDLNTARDGLHGGAGTQTAGQVTGGRGPSSSLALNELYDGTSFTESADLNSARQFTTGFGATNTASVTAGGNQPPYTATGALTETWDGSSFTERNDLNNARYAMGGAGTQTAGHVFGGTDTDNRAYSETWDGTNWTEVSDLNTARGGPGGCGTQTAAIAFGGYAPGTVVNNTETWDGTSWTEVNNLNTAREKPAGSGTQTVALSTGGDPPASATNELWNGTSWTEIADLSTARGASGTCNTSATATFVAGGRNASGTKVATTEEFTVDLANKTITAS